MADTYNRLDSLIEKMTLEEKASLCSGKDNWYTKGIERLGIPSVMVSDGPHGLRTQHGETDHLGLNGSIKAVCFPAACATAASFSKTLAKKLGETLGEECVSEQVSVLLGPAINIKRSPLCGRNFEYFSEDPFLSGELATGYVNGVQSRGVGVSVKHYAANNQETRRMTVSADIDERSLREIYLSGFERVVKNAKPHTLMCAYNRVNGEYASQNKRLLTDILREEWGFDGFVMSDWGAVVDRVKGLEAGLNLEMPFSGGETDKQIVDAVTSGRLDVKVLDQAVKQILTIVFQEKEALEKAEKGTTNWELHHKIAVEAAEECIVLLKNDGCLPLKQDERIALIGEFAFNPRYQGGGSSHVNAYQVTGAAQFITGENVLTAKGFDSTNASNNLRLLAEAVEAAKRVSSVVIFAGLPDSFESEGYDRKHMCLPAEQNDLIQAICAVNKNVIVALHNGSPVEMPWIDKVSAVLELYLGGEGVGQATANVLLGKVSPSGRLPETFPLSLVDNPSYLSFPGDGNHCVYSEGIYVGYRYYDKKRVKTLFPFGHGLSYSEFSYSNLAIDGKDFDDKDFITVSVDVKNIGAITAKEVVQLYVAYKGDKISCPVKELKEFDKIELERDESKRVTFKLPKRAFAYYNETASCWHIAGGDYEVIIAKNVLQPILSTTINMKASQTFSAVTRETTMGELRLNKGTKPFVDTFVSRALSKYAVKENGEENGIITEDFILGLVEGMPLRGLQNLLKYSWEQLDLLISQLNAQVKTEW